MKVFPIPEIVSQGDWRTAAMAAQMTVMRTPERISRTAPLGPTISADSHRTVSARTADSRPGPLPGPLGRPKGLQAVLRILEICVIVVVVPPICPHCCCYCCYYFLRLRYYCCCYCCFRLRYCCYCCCYCSRDLRCCCYYCCCYFRGLHCCYYCCYCCCSSWPCTCRDSGVTTGPLSESRARAVGSLGRGAGDGGLGRHRHGDDEGGGHHCTGGESASDLGHVEHPMSY